MRVWLYAVPGLRYTVRRKLYLIFKFEMRKVLITILILVGLTLSAPGCSAYKIDIRQGNTLDPEVIDSLRVGMSKQQVVFLMGTPLVQDPFHPNRWDYVYTFKPGGGKMTRQHVCLYFEGDRLSKIDKAGMQSEKAAAP